MLLYFFGLPFVIGLVFWAFGLLKATAAVAGMLMWMAGCFVVDGLILLNQGNPFVALAVYFVAFLGPLVGLALGAVLSKPVPFNQTPAGQAKAHYDALPPDQRAKLNGMARKAAGVGVFHFGAWLRRKGHTSTARAINDGWKMFE